MKKMEFRNGEQEQDDSSSSATAALRQRNVAKAGDTGAEAKHSNKREGAPVYTLEEVARHRGPKSYWMAVGDCVYDVSSFVLSGQHPGGDLIAQGMGRDATVLFKTSHPPRVSAILEKYYLGELQRPASGYQYNWNSKFYDVLQERVEGHFRDTKTAKQDSLLMWVQAFQTVFCFLVFLYLGYVQGNLLACVVMGWFFSQFGIVIMHDGTHGGFSKNPTISKMASMVMDVVMGASSLVWKHEHNIGHHQYTNTIEDPDATTAYPILRYHPSQPWRSYHRFQHLYVWLLYPFIVYKWYIADVMFIIKRQYRNIPMYDPPTSYLILLVFTKAFLILWVILLPCYIHGTIYGLTCMLAAFCTASYAFAMQFVVTHLADDVAFPEESGQDSDWAKCQVFGSSNYATGSFLATWFSGGLNHQIEHHLFPTIAHTRLPEIAPIVKRTCAEFGLPYYEHESFWEAVQHHYRHLLRMSFRPANAVKPIPAATAYKPTVAKYDVLLFSSCALFFGILMTAAYVYN